MNLTVDRTNLKGTIAHFKRSNSEFNPLIVQFSGGSDEEYTTSESPSSSRGVVVDSVVGPLREFYTLLIKEFIKSDFDMFEGHGSVLLPVNNQKAIDNNMFKIFGKIVVSSVISGGPGFPHFPPYIVHFLQEKEFMHEVMTDHIINKYLLEYINNVSINVTIFIF